MTNSDDTKLDDFQNPDEEQDRDQLELDILREDTVNIDEADDASVDPDMFFEELAVNLGLPDESLMGENTATYADELDMFDDLESQDAGEIFGAGQVPDDAQEEINVFDEVSEASFDDSVLESPTFDNPTDDSASDSVSPILNAVDEDEQSVVAEELLASDLPLPLEEVPVVVEKIAKKGKKEKPPKKEKVPKVKKEKPPKKEKAPKVKKEKKPKEPREKRPWNIAEIDVALAVAAISLVIGCLFMLANLASNLS
ncbi:MAG: hypothetical protein FWH27_07410 [Planctomycetaceae bacterium]|nr:hypothetical protein [Planctomycetaceae bacterium]